MAKFGRLREAVLLESDASVKRVEATIAVAIGAGVLTMLGMHMHVEAQESAGNCAAVLPEEATVFTSQNFLAECTRFADDFRVRGATPGQDTFAFPGRDEFVSIHGGR